MPPTPAPAARALLAQATKLWPSRNRASDGIMSSDAHKKQNPRSGHDHGNAVDLTHDPANGCGAHEWADAILKRRDPRVLYVISRRRIWSVARYAEGWRPYTGSNPHDKHAHFEIDPTKRNDTSDWFGSERFTPAPLPPKEASMASPDERRALVRLAFLATLGRHPETAAVQEQWAQRVATEGLDAVVRGIADSPEARKRRESAPRLDGTTA